MTEEEFRKGKAMPEHASPTVDPQTDNLDRFSQPVQAKLRWFRFRHLPPKLQEVSASFYRLAIETADRSAEHEPAETIIALNHLLTAKDAAVRAFIGSRERQGKGMG